MGNEQEGVELIDPNVEGVVLPNVGNIEEVEQEEQEVESEEILDTNIEKEQPEENLLLKALNAERRKNKELNKKIKQYQNNKTSKSTYDTLVEQGIEAELAKTLAQAIDKPSADVARLQFKTDLLEASKNPEFADIASYEDEIKTFVDKGLTVEQAYYATTGGQKKSNNTTSEITRQVEAKIKNRSEKAKLLDIDTTTTTSNVKENKLKYSAIELATAKAAGMTIEEYKAFQNMSSANEVERYNQAKKK